MKKWFLVLIMMFAVSVPAFAGVQVYIDDTERGFANKISVSSSYATYVGDSLTITAPAMAEGESIVNTTDDLVRIQSNDSHIALEVYSPLTSNGTSEIRLTGDAGADATDSFRIKNDAAGNYTIDNDNASAGTYVNLYTLTSAGAGTIKGTTNGSFTVAGLGTSNGTAELILSGDAGADATDRWKLINNSDGTVLLQNDSAVAGTYVTKATLTSTGSLTLTGGLTGGVQALTTSSADPGVGVVNLTTLVTQVTTDDTGSAADVVTLAAGTAGQIKIVTLAADTETAGLSLDADFQGATAHLLFEDVDDSCVLISDGTEWTILINNGGTAS